MIMLCANNFGSFVGVRSTRPETGSSLVSMARLEPSDVLRRSSMPPEPSASRYAWDSIQANARSEATIWAASPFTSQAASVRWPRQARFLFPARSRTWSWAQASISGKRRARAQGRAGKLETLRSIGLKRKHDGDPGVCVASCRAREPGCRPPACPIRSRGAHLARRKGALYGRIRNGREAVTRANEVTTTPLDRAR